MYVVQVAIPKIRAVWEMYIFEYVNEQSFKIRREEHSEAVPKQPMYAGKCSVWCIAEHAGE